MWRGIAFNRARGITWAKKVCQTFIVAPLAYALLIARCAHCRYHANVFEPSALKPADEGRLRGDKIHIFHFSITLLRTQYKLALTRDKKRIEEQLAAGVQRVFEQAQRRDWVCAVIEHAEAKEGVETRKQRQMLDYKQMESQRGAQEMIQKQKLQIRPHRRVEPHNLARGVA